MLKTLRENQSAAADSLGDTLVTPEAAREKLVALGYTKDTWELMMQNTSGSHYTRALVEIAKRPTATDINEVYNELFPEKEHHTQADGDAAKSSEATFDKYKEGFNREATTNIGKVVIHAAQAGSEDEAIVRAQGRHS